MKRIWNPVTQVRIAEISGRIDPYLSKSCYFCKEDFGTGQDVQVVDFINHLIDKHPLNIDKESMTKDKEFILKKFS
jgi:hypothetical protein